MVSARSVPAPAVTKGMNGGEGGMVLMVNLSENMVFGVLLLYAALLGIVSYCL